MMFLHETYVTMLRHCNDYDRVFVNNDQMRYESSANGWILLRENGCDLVGDFECCDRS